MSLLKSRGAWIGIGLTALLVALVVFRVVQAGAPDEPSPSVEEIRADQGVPVAVATARRGPVELWRPFTGTVSGTREAVLRARSQDQVSEVPVETGDRVAQGDVLVRVSGDATEARVRQAETALRQAERRVERLEPLHAAGAISDQEWEDAQTQAEMARDDLAAAREGLRLTSPMAGTVTEVLARPGLVPDVGEALVRVADLSGMVVRVRVSAPDARAIQRGQPVRLRSDPEVTGQVQRIALQADPVTRLVEVEVGFPPDAGLVPGTFMTVEIRTAARDDAVTVPRAALRDDVVWVVDDDVAHGRSVEAGITTADRVEIQEGIAEGERVVVEGASLLGDGTRVRVTSGDAPGTGPEGGAR